MISSNYHSLFRRTAMFTLSSAYFSLGKYEKMIEYGQQTLTIAREIKDRNFEQTALFILDIAYFSLGK